MKFSTFATISTIAATLLAVTGRPTDAASDAGQCVIGNGEFTFRGAVDAHFTLDACLESSATNIASGHVRSGQFNEDGDVTEYDVHCMHVHQDGSKVYIGAEIHQLSKYIENHQTPELFRQSLVDGDRDYIMAYERKVHTKHSNNPKYMNSLSAFLKSKGHTIESYEEGLGLGLGNGGRRMLKTKKKSAKGSKSAAPIPLQINECAQIVLEMPSICDNMLVLGPPPDTPDFDFDIREIDASTVTDEEVQEELNDVCLFFAGFSCFYTAETVTEYLDAGPGLPGLPGGPGLPAGPGPGRHLTKRDDAADADAQGTLVLFELSLNLNGDAIAVKFGHGFDTSCVNFADEIDGDFFTEDTVDQLTAGAMSLN